MGCGASSQPAEAWKCSHCAQTFATFDACAAHEKECQFRPGAGNQPPPQAAEPVPQQKTEPEVPKAAPETSDLNDFLLGLGVRDIPAASAALIQAGICNRNDFFNLDKAMRGELDEELKAKGVSLGDRAKIKKAEQASVPVKQGNGEVKVLMLQPGQAMQTTKALERVFLGIGWTNRASGGSIDVDASCVGFGQGQPKEIIAFTSLKNPNQSVVHTGDVLRGSDSKDAKIADMERIYVWLSKVPNYVDCLTFVASIYSSGSDFADLSSAYCRLVNADTNQELARMNLAGGGLKGNALVFSKLYRCYGPQGAWHFQTLGMPASVPGCSQVQSMIPMLQSSGSAFIPPAAAQAQVVQGVPVGTPVPDAKVEAVQQPPAKKQTPTGVYVCGGLAVAGAAGIAAATAIFLAPNLDMSMFRPSLFEDGVDFSVLEPVTDVLEGIGEGIADGAEDAFEFAAGVTEGISLDGVGDALGDAVGTVGDAAGDAANAIGDAAPDAIDAVGGAVGDAGDAIGDVAPDAIDAVGGFAGDAGDAIGDAAGGIGDAIGDVAPDAIDAVGDAFGNVGDLVGDVAPDAMEAVGGFAQSAINAAPGILDAVGGVLGGLGGIF